MYSSPHSKTSIAILPVLLTIVLLAGCNLPNTIPVSLTAVPTLPATLTSPPPINTATSPAPTLTLFPSLTSTPQPDQLVFARGATAGVATGNLKPIEVKSFSFRASEGQPLILLLKSPQNDLVLGVTNPDGSKLLDPSKKWNSLQWLLPKTGVYTVQVLGATIAENYTLTAKIAALVGFASGSDTATLTGKTVNGLVVSYAAYCTAGQTMTTSLNVPSTTAYLDVFGIAYGPLLNPSSKLSTWTGVLPSTENYIVEVIPTNGSEVSYTLTLKCH